jgi:hypothetical protein
MPSIDNRHNTMSEVNLVAVLYPKPEKAEEVRLVPIQTTSRN